MFNRKSALLVFVLLLTSQVMFGQNKNKQPDLDTLVQNDSFRTLDWLADTFSKSVMLKKSNEIVGLLPSFGTYLKYSRKIAPSLSNGTRSARYIYFKSRFAKKHKKLRKQMSKEGLSFTKAVIQEIKADSGISEDSISFCKLRVYYKRKKHKFLVECHGIKINNQWFLLDGFTFERRD